MKHQACLVKMQKKMQKITHNKIPELLKGIMSNLITIGAISQFLPDREQERIRRISESELDRAERMRDKINERLSRS